MRHSEDNYLVADASRALGSLVVVIVAYPLSESWAYAQFRREGHAWGNTSRTLMLAWSATAAVDAFLGASILIYLRTSASPWEPTRQTPWFWFTAGAALAKVGFSLMNASTSLIFSIGWANRFNVLAPFVWCVNFAMPVASLVLVANLVRSRRRALPSALPPLQWSVAPPWPLSHGSIRTYGRAIRCSPDTTGAALRYEPRSLRDSRRVDLSSLSQSS